MADMDVVLSQDLRDRHALGLTRRLPQPRNPEVDMGSNDYLGLAQHPDVVASAVASVQKYGAGSTGARLISGNLPVHEQLEQAIASLKGAEAALVFPSGFQAATGTIPALVSGGDLILSDELNHACLIDGCRMSRATVRVYSHNDVDSLRQRLADRKRFRRCLIVTDGVFSMDGDIADLAALADICDRFDAWLMVDDAHGTGVLGADGAGSVSHCGVHGRVDVQMGTMSKALGASGGFIAGSSTLIQHLLNNARSFVYTTGPSPASSGAALAALQIMRTDPARRARLSANASYLRAGLRSIGLTIPDGETPIIPVVIGSSDMVMRLAEELYPRLGIAGIRPPAVPEGTSRLRVTVKAVHEKRDLDLAIELFDSALRKYGWRQFVFEGFPTR